MRNIQHRLQEVEAKFRLYLFTATLAALIAFFKPNFIRVPIHYPLLKPQDVKTHTAKPSNSLSAMFPVHDLKVSFGTDLDNELYHRNLANGNPTQSPSTRPSATNQETITFTYAIEFGSASSSRNDAKILIDDIEVDIGGYLENIGYSSHFVSSDIISSDQQQEGSCLMSSSSSFCTLVEVFVDVSSVSRKVVEQEVTNFIQLYIERMNVFRGSNGVEALVINAIITDFTYVYSTTDFNAPFFSFDSKISRAVATKGYEVLSFMSMLDQFLGPGYMPRGTACQPDFVECTLNIGTISVAKRTTGTDESEILDLLRSISSFMETRDNVDITMVLYVSPDLPVLGVPSAEPSNSPIITPPPTNVPTNGPTAVYKETVNFIYALEYEYSGSPPDILDLLIEGVKTQISTILSNDGFKTKFISSTPKSSELPGSCNIDNLDSFCTLVDTVLEISSFSTQFDEMDIIYSIKPRIEDLRLTDDRVGLDGRIKFVTDVEFTYLYSTTDLNFPFFSFDPIIARGIKAQGVDIFAFHSELIQFLGGAFWPKGSRCHEDYVECTLNKGVLTIPLPTRGRKNEMEELVLRASNTFMMGRTDNDVSMVTYRTPEFNDPTSTPSFAPSVLPVTTISPTDDMIQVNVEYALESSSPRLVQSLKVYIEPTIKHVNTEILQYLSKFVRVRGMTANLFKECKQSDLDTFCAMISSDIQVKIDSRDSVNSIEELTKRSFSDFLDDKIVVASKLGVTVRLYQFFEFDFKYLILQETSEISSYDKVDSEINSLILNNGYLEILAVDFRVDPSRRRLQEKMCAEKQAFCAFRNCMIVASAHPLEQDELKLKLLILARAFMVERGDTLTRLIYSSPELPRYTPKPSTNPSLHPTNMPTILFPSLEPSTKPVMDTFSPTSSPTQKQRAVSFELRMEGKFLEDPINMHLNSLFCPDCTYISITNNQIKEGITDTFKDGPNFFESVQRNRKHDMQGLHLIVTEANTVFKGDCGSGCMLFICHVKVINVQPDITKDAFDFEFLSTAEALFDNGQGIKIPGQTIEISFVGPFAAFAEIHVNLVGKKALPDMTDNSKRIFEDATQIFLSNMLQNEDIPCRIIKVECLDQFTNGDVARGEVPDDIFDRSVPSVVSTDYKGLLLSLKVRFMGFFTPTSNNEDFTIVVERLVEESYNGYLESLISTDNAYFKLLNDDVIMPDQKNDSSIDLNDDINVEDILNNTNRNNDTSNSPPKSNPGDNQGMPNESEVWNIPMISVPISIVGVGFAIIIFHMRGKSQPYVEYDEMLHAYGEFG